MSTHVAAQTIAAAFLFLSNATPFPSNSVAAFQDPLLAWGSRRKYFLHRPRARSVLAAGEWTGNVETSGGLSGFLLGLLWVQPEGLSDEEVRDIVRRRYPSAPSGSDDWPLEGRVVAITGAAGGLGRALSDVVVSVLGGTVVAMDVDKAGLALIAADLDAGDSPGRFVPLAVNHADLDSVRSAALSVRSAHPRIDVLVNNAGLCYDFPDDEIDRAGATAQGHDLLFGVNYLSHVLLTELLLPCLERADGGGRIVQVTSGYHAMVDGSMLVPTDPESDTEELAGAEAAAVAEATAAGRDVPPAPPASRGPRRGRWSRHAGRAYTNSKMAQIWHARCLARYPRTRRQGSSGDDDPGAPAGGATPVAAVCACPSWVGTGIAGEAGRDALARFAFPARRGGAGITSVLNAMFRPADELGVDVLSSSGNSYVGNARVIENLAPFRSIWMTSPFVTKLGWRDGIVSAFSVVILAFQRFFYDDFIVQRTSPDCDDTERQDALHCWSLKCIEPWLDENR